MYINRKDGTLVEAKLCHYVYEVLDDKGDIKVLSIKDFQAQYGEAMVNNPMIPSDDKPHIKDKFCDNLGCIPYIPKQKQGNADELQMPKPKPDSSLLLSEMKAVEKAIELQKYSEDEGYVLMPADYYRAGMVAELDHLAKLGIVYVKKDLGILGRGHNYTFIPLSDYMKQMEVKK